MAKPLKRSLLLALLGLGACSSYDSVVAEFDSIAGFDPETQTEPEELDYRDQAERYPWILRQLEWAGVGGVFGSFFSFRRQPWAVEEPAGFARQRIRRMAAVAENDLLKAAGVTWRLLLVVDLDETELNRAIAVRELGALLERIGEERIEPQDAGFVLEAADEAVFREAAAPLVEAVEGDWPNDEGERPEAEARDAYATALRDLSALPAATLEQERSRMRLLLEAFRGEVDPALRRQVALFLVRVVRAAGKHGLSRALSDPAPAVRKAALQQLWNLGRDDLWPWVLAKLARQARLREPGTPIDPDPDVRRRLVQLCWALRPENAEATFGDGPSAFAVLHEIALEDAEQALRIQASEALAFLVGRPEIDPHGRWIREWWERFVTEAATRR